MNTSTRILITTGFASLMGLTLLTPSTFAQDMGAPKDTPPVLQLADLGGQHNADDQRGGRRGGRGGVAGLICSPDGAAQLETRLTDLATQLKLTTEQQPLFDTYQTAALDAQTGFADACPQPMATADQPTTRPDALTMLQHRQARATAELEAINAVLPSFEALYASLTDTQKADLMALAGPHHGPRGDDHRSDRAGRHDDRGDDDRSGDDRGGERGRGGDRGRH